MDKYLKWVIQTMNTIINKIIWETYQAALNLSTAMIEEEYSSLLWSIRPHSFYFLTSQII
jgi:hypothetical protein